MLMDQENKFCDELEWGGLRARTKCFLFTLSKQFKRFRHRFRCHIFTAEYEYELI